MPVTLAISRSHYNYLSNVLLFYTWCNMLLTGLHHSPVVGIPPTPLSPIPLPTHELGAILIIKSCDAHYCGVSIQGTLNSLKHYSTMMSRGLRGGGPSIGRESL